MFRIIPEGPNYSEFVLLKNGQGILLRPATPEDKPLIKEFLKRVSPESLRMRFMASISAIPENFFDILCTGDFTSKGCLLAITGKDEEEKVVGMGNYIETGNGRSVEVAFLIQDDYQGKGISTLLLERLAGLAAANGFIELEAEVLPENQPMLNVFKDSGFENHKVWSSDTVHIELPVSESAAVWKRAELRERIAVANSLMPALRPKSIAVVGASRDPKSIGHLIFKNILGGGFTGSVYAVNPEADELIGQTAYSSLNDLPGKIDLAVIAVPAEKVQSVAERAIHAGAKALIVVSAGFAEAGEEGKLRQKQLVELIRTHGVRLIGPSCLGLMNTAPDIKLNASLAPGLAKRGSAGLFSHSAALGLVILDYAMEKGIGFTTFVSAGNRADVSGNDLLQYWEEDTDTKMAILYLETFGNPRKFVRIARRMTYKKPILCVKSAKSAAGRKTVEAKTGAPSSGTRQVEALFQQTGVILADTLEELFDVALVLQHQPLPLGNKVSIIANSAGMATLFADSCESNGLVISGPGVVDLGAFTSPENYEEAVRKALTDENVDSVLVGYASVGESSIEQISAAILKGVNSAEKETGIKKPVLLCLMGAAGTVSLISESSDSDEQKFPSFRFPESAAKALGKIARYVEFRKQPAGKIVWFDDVKPEDARSIVKDILGNVSSDESIVDVDEKHARGILNSFGLNIKDSADDVNQTIIIKVMPDKLFGPLIQVELNNSVKVIRITPLTDRDINEISQNIFGKENENLNNILGRISQMIEELPWLWQFEVNASVETEPAILPSILMILKPGGGKRPAY